MLGVGELNRRSRWTQSVLAVAADMRIVALLIPRSTMSKLIGDVGVIGVCGMAAGHCHEPLSPAVSSLCSVVYAVLDGFGVYAVDDGAVYAVVDVAGCVDAGWGLMMGVIRGS